MKKTIRKCSHFSGKPVIPGDKSISHRGLIFGAMASGTSEVHDILDSEDVRSTAQCLRELGAKIETKGNITYVEGVGDTGFTRPSGTLDCGNSGTTMRLMMGVLSGVDFPVSLTGDISLVKRPMKRVADPLREMGAKFELTNENYAPFTMTGGKTHGINYHLKIASAQIKSAIILAALQAEGETTITGEIDSRDHTERLLPHYGCSIQVSKDKITIPGKQKFTPNKIRVPSDPSTAAFWIGATCIIPGASLEVENISLNPTRTGLINVLKRMGADIETEITSAEPEPVGIIRVRYAGLKGTKLFNEEIPSLIDEIPLLAVLATCAAGETVVTGAEELRVKESDRIEAVASNLRKMGAELEVFEDGFKIIGPQKLTGTEIATYHDHRIAMAFAIAGLVAAGETIIENAECASVSYPKFYDTLEELTRP